jgi:ribonuclease HI
MIMGIRNKRHRKIKAVGSYCGLIVATDSPDFGHAPGASAHAWEVKPFDARESLSDLTLSDPRWDGDVASSDGLESGEVQGFISAVYRTCEATPDRSQLHLYCKNDYIVRAINEWLPIWRANGWRNAQGKLIEHHEWWQLIDELCAKRHITLSAERPGSRDFLILLALDRLLDKARAACAQRKRQGVR